MTDPKTPKLPEGYTHLYLRSSVLRVQRWRRNMANKGEGVPRHIHERAQFVKQFMEGEGLVR